MVAAVLHFSKFRSFTQQSMLFFTLTDSTQLSPVVEVITQCCDDYRVVSIIVNKENAIRYQYAFSLKKNVSKELMIDALRKLEMAKQIKITANELTLL